MRRNLNILYYIPKLNLKNFLKHPSADESAAQSERTGMPGISKFLRHSAYLKASRHNMAKPDPLLRIYVENELWYNLRAVYIYEVKEKTQNESKMVTVTILLNVNKPI